MNLPEELQTCTGRCSLEELPGRTRVFSHSSPPEEDPVVILGVVKCRTCNSIWSYSQKNLVTKFKKVGP